MQRFPRMSSVSVDLSTHSPPSHKARNRNTLNSSRVSDLISVNNSIRLDPNASQSYVSLDDGGSNFGSRVSFSSAPNPAKTSAAKEPLSEEVPETTHLVPKAGEEERFYSHFVSVRMFTAVLCLLLIAFTAAILLAVTFTFSLSAAKDLATSHVQIISSKAKGDIEAYLNGPINYLNSWQYSLSTGDVRLPVDEPIYPNDDWSIPWMERVVGPLAASKFTYQYTIFGFNDGNAILCVTYPGDTFRCQLYAWGYRNGSDPTQFTNVTNTDHLKSNFSLTGSNWAPDVYDPRKRTWYKQGTTAPGLMAWSNAFLSTVPTYPCVCVSAGIYNSTGAFIGVGSVFINLDTMEVFLGNLLAVANTVSVLIDNQGLLLASTYVDPVSVTTNWTGSSSSPVPSNCLRSDVANGAAKNVLMCRQRATTYGYAPLRLQVEANLPSRTPEPCRQAPMALPSSSWPAAITS